MSNSSGARCAEFPKRALLVSAFFVVGIISAVKPISIRAQTLESKYKEFIPPSAEVQALRAYDPTTKKESRKSGMKLGRLGDRRSKDLVFVYKQQDRLHLRVVRNPNGKAKILDEALPGTFVWMQDFKTKGFEVANLDGEDGEEILTMTSEGASLGAYLNIFAIRNNRLESVLDKPKGREVGGYRINLEPVENGRYRIIVSIDKEGRTTEIYQWDGKNFARTRKLSGSGTRNLRKVGR
jgi:hypothetical protein